VIYQIYPRSFADSDGDGVGDLPGVISRLDYLASLGVQAIWLSPFYPSPMVDFGYDVADYVDVDPLFGTLGDFDELVAQAHRRGIKVLVDWVANHTSDQHPWFVESRAARDSQKRDWYVWRDPGVGGPPDKPPNGWPACLAGSGAAWRLDERTGQYYLHSFTPEQPDLNWENPEVESAMHDVLRFWLDRGVDGFRLDAIFRIAKDPLLGENEPELRHDEDWPTIHDRLRRLRQVTDEYADRVLVGEVYLRDLRKLVPYVATGDELHLAHNFVFVHLPWEAKAVSDSVAEFEQLAGEAWPAWFLENHDHPRVATRYAGAAHGSGARRGRLAMMLVCTLRGTPFVYQGQELGLPDAHVPADRVVDVDGRDPERAPLPWRRPSAAGAGAGFTTGEPWLPIVADAEHLCVDAQDGDPASTLAFSRRLLDLRGTLPALSGGTQRTLASGTDVYCYMRESGDRLLVALNFSSSRRPLELSEPVGSGAVVQLSTDPGRAVGSAVDHQTLELGPDEGVILRITRG
jgi:alpha-glucosidase